MVFNKALLGKWFWRFVKERNPLGNGWCGDMSLRDEFSGLYAIASFKDAWVWVMHSSMRGVLLSWNGVLVGKERKRLGKLLLFAFFGPFGGNEIGELLRIRNA
ncbi:hypothetical protein CK203_034432 [Vitis vinifera]|uniref:Uncharacterized protein n=1 Tax=Vitis vinifera TaxID=29760 RepID=A0A438HZG3_VITVI|nr:hypothetical protein CK203_034432 [Vitis vinifera]